MTTIKETLVDVYRSHGIDFMTACQYATEFVRDLRSQATGTVWYVNRFDGTSIGIRNDRTAS